MTYFDYSTLMKKVKCNTTANIFTPPYILVRRSRQANRKACRLEQRKQIVRFYLERRLIARQRSDGGNQFIVGAGIEFYPFEDRQVERTGYLFFDDFYKQSIPQIGKLGFHSQYYIICIKKTREETVQTFFCFLAKKRENSTFEISLKTSCSEFSGIRRPCIIFHYICNTES